MEVSKGGRFSSGTTLITCFISSDVDNRVRAIAKEVFGLTTVIWNQDSEGKGFLAIVLICRILIDQNQSLAVH